MYVNSFTDSACVSNSSVNSSKNILSGDLRHVCVLMIIGCQNDSYFEKCSVGYFSLVKQLTEEKIQL